MKCTPSTKKNCTPMESTSPHFRTIHGQGRHAVLALHWRWCSLLVSSPLNEARETIKTTSCDRGGGWCGPRSGEASAERYREKQGEYPIAQAIASAAARNARASAQQQRRCCPCESEMGQKDKPVAKHASQVMTMLFFMMLFRPVARSIWQGVLSHTVTQGSIVLVVNSRR